MNKANKLLDKQYVMDLFKKKVLPLYPDFSGIKRIKIIPHKDFIWDHTYHVVIEYRTLFVSKDKKLKTLPIYCSAHSDEPRKNVYDALQFLWRHGFGRGYYTIPHPLFYSNYFQGTFYRGVEGNNLYAYIRGHDMETIEDMLPKTARWFAKLHALSVGSARNFNRDNSRIATVYPGIPHILDRIAEHYPEYRKVFERIYELLVAREEKFLDNTKKRWLVHGDAHPENVIRMGRKKIAVIDFTDLCLSDFTRDVGTFLQQIEFMVMRKIGDLSYAEEMKKLFLDRYFAVSKIKPDSKIRERIDTYYYWTAMRTAGFFLLKDQREPERAHPLIEKAVEGLGLR